MTLESTILQAALWGYGALFAWAAVSDAMTYRIPNPVSLALVALFVAAAPFSALGLAAFGWHVGIGVAALALCIGLFALGVFGGGDAKLLAAAALWAGPAGLVHLVFWTAAVGGALSIALLFFRRVPLPQAALGLPWIVRLHAGAEGVPYGIAIAAGALAAAPHAELFGTVV